MNRLYHKDIYMPAIKFENKSFRLEYKDYVLNRAFEREINLSRFESVNLCNGELIELETVNRMPVKIVMRYKYNSQYDICIVILLGSFIVKTVWLNHVNDKHDTLDTSKYYKPRR